MTDEIRFTVPGVPVGKGRPRMTRGGHVYTPERTRTYENRVRIAAIESAGLWGTWMRSGVFEIVVEAVFPIPASWKKADRIAAEQGVMRHASKPDADNVLKAVVDGCAGTGLFDDDAQFVGMSVFKRYGRVPHCDVTIRRVEGIRHASR